LWKETPSPPSFLQLGDTQPTKGKTEKLWRVVKGGVAGRRGLKNANER